MKNFRIFLGFIALVAAFYGTVTNDYAPLLMVGFVSAIVSIKAPRQEVAYACLTACALGSPSSQTGTCGDKGGVRRMYWAKFSDVDWATMRTTSASFDTATHEVKAFTMLASAVFKIINHDQKLGEAEAVFSETDGFYKNSIKTAFMGQSAANRKIFFDALNCRNIVVITVLNNGTMRLYGVDYDTVTLGKILTPLYVGTHGDYSGTLGGNSKSRDEVTIEGESFTPPLFLNMLESTIPV